MKGKYVLHELVLYNEFSKKECLHVCTDPCLLTIHIVGNYIQRTYGGREGREVHER